MNNSSFHGLPTQILQNDHLRLEILAEAGPRIVRFSLPNGDNLFAELPNTAIDAVQGPYNLLGGHRLWHAPERFSRTYIPDDGGLQLAKLGNNHITLTQPTESPSGIQKQIEIQLHADRPAATLTHRLTNRGVWPITLAPWAITQLRHGGTAVLPQQISPIDADGLLPNRQLNLWSYADVNDARLQLGNQFILIHGQAAPPFKLGYLNRAGWAAYALNNLLFVKRFTPHLTANYPDQNSNVELYVNELFLELETLAPMTTLDEGETAVHTETWELHPLSITINNERSAQAVANQINQSTKDTT